MIYFDFLHGQTFLLCLSQVEYLGDGRFLYLRDFRRICWVFEVVALILKGSILMHACGSEFVDIFHDNLIECLVIYGYVNGDDHLYIIFVLFLVNQKSIPNPHELLYTLYIVNYYTNTYCRCPFSPRSLTIPYLSITTLIGLLICK